MTKFTDWALRARPVLKARFQFDDLDVAAIFGNGGAESNGFTQMQELHPTVKGSRGGLGGWQWTGPRRRMFENFCTVKKYHPDQYEANLEFLIQELSGSERKAVQKTKDAVGLYDKTVAFEQGFERAGIKHYDVRYRWAQKAATAFAAAGHIDPPLPKPKPVKVPPPPDVPAPEPKESRNKDDAVIDLNPKTVVTVLTGGGAVSVLSMLNGISTVYGLVAFLAVFAVVGFVIWKVWIKKRRND